MPGGGIGIFVKTLAESLAKKGVDVYVLGFGRKQERPEVINEVKVHWISLPNPLYKNIKIGGYPYSLAAIIKRHFLSNALKRLITSENIDLVESYDFSGPLAYQPPCPTIVRLHGSVFVYRHGEGRPTHISPLDRYFEIKNVNFSEHTVAVSQHIGKVTNQIMGLNKSYRVIYNGVDTNLFSPQQGPKDINSILFVGNLMWRKGVFDLIRAMPIVLKQYPNAQLKIAGGAAGVHHEQLEQTLQEIGQIARKQIQFLGKVPHADLPKIINQASVFAFPSRVEAFGLTCTEAMASGTELVEDGRSGLLADPAKPEDFAQKICAILADPALGQRLGQAARERAVDRFNLEKNLDQNYEFYHKVLNS